MIDAMIITYNEALNLPKCLAALRGWTRGIFVVDSGSTDGTPELAREAGAEVVHHDWEGYARQKNWALRNLPFESDWLLLVDADEVITPAVRERLVQIASQPTDEVSENGFFINRLTYFTGRPIRHCGYFPNWNLRFFKRGCGIFEDRAVHEHVMIDDPVGFVKEAMIHDDRRGLEHYIAKHNRYSTLEARSLFDEVFGHGPRVHEANVSKETRRRRWLKRHVMPRVPFPALWRFLYIYVGRLGVLDGRVGLDFCRFISMYDGMVALKLRDLRRQSKRASGPASAGTRPVEGLAQPEGTVPVTPTSEDDAVGSSDGDPSGLMPRNFLTRLVPMLGCEDRVVVTGGSGFLGTNLVELYRACGAEVISVDKSQPRNPDHKELWREIDILDRDQVGSCVREFEPTLLFHLAARTDLDEHATLDGYSANTAGVESVLRSIEGLSSLRRVIVTSSQLVCQPGYQPESDDDYSPHTLYGRSKIETERITRSWSSPPCPWTLVRPTSIWGPWFDVPYRDFFLAIARRQYRHPRGRPGLRSFGFVGNAVYEYARLANAVADEVDRRTFYISDVDPLSVRQWANLIQSEIGRPPVHEVSVAALTLAAKVGDVTHRLGFKWPPITSFRLRNLLSDNYYDMSALREVVGEMPYTVEEGVHVTVQWMREMRLI